MFFDPGPMGNPWGEPWHPECKSCRGVIGPDEATEQLHFDRDEEHRLDEMNGTYHAECARPYLSIKRALDALTRGFF